MKKISKHIYGKTYSPGLVSRFNKELGEALALWQERPIEKEITYLFLDAVNLPEDVIKHQKRHFSVQLVPQIQEKRSFWILCWVEKSANYLGRSYFFG